MADGTQKLTVLSLDVWARGQKAKHGGSLCSLSTEEPETKLLGPAVQIAWPNQFRDRPFKKLWRIIMDTLLAWDTHIHRHNAHHQISHDRLCQRKDVYQSFVCLSYCLG